MRKNLFLTFFIFSSLLASSQTSEINGRLLDASQNPVVGASIKLQGTDQGTISGPQGYFHLTVPSPESLVEITSVGFLSIKKTAKEINEVLELTESIYQMPEFVLETMTLTSGKQGIQSIPGSVQYIDAAQLGKQKYTNVNDILKGVPGVNLQEEDGFGLRPNIGLRGSGLERSSKITVMEDGILASPAPYAAPSAYYFPTVGRMSGVEVLKGSSQVRFGPFTTGGAINFLSTPIPNQLSAYAGLTVGSFGISNMHAYFGDQIENFGYVLEAFQYGADGFKTVENGSAGFLKNDLNAKFSFNSDAAKNVFQKWTVGIGWTNENSDETYLGLTEEDFNDDPYKRYASSQLDNMDAEQTRLSLTHYIEIPRLFNVVTTLYRNDFHRNWYKLQSVAGESLSNVLEDPMAHSHEYELLSGMSNAEAGELVLRANNRAYFSQGIQTAINLDFETGSVNHEITLSTRIHEDEEDRFQHQDGYSMTERKMSLFNAGAPGSHANRIEHAKAIATYLFYQLDFGKFSVTPGVRHEHVTISREDFGKADPWRLVNDDYSSRSNQFSSFLPGLGVNYSISKSSQIFGGVHRGFAPGGSKEGARPESSINYELGARAVRPSFSGSLVLFMNDYKNLLGADNASAGGEGTGDLFNAGEALTKGVELEVSYDFGKSSKNYSLPVTLAYTYTDARFENTFESEFDGWGSVSRGDEIPYLARNQLFAGVDFRTEKIGVNLTGKFQSDIRTTPGSGDIATSELIQGFFTSDLSFNYYLDQSITFFTSITNVLDEKYAVSRRPAGLRPGMPRTFRIGASVRL